MGNMKNSFVRHLNNESGGLLVQAIIATVVIGIAAMTIMQRSLDITRQLRLPRIKAAQGNVEFALRHLLLQPSIYTGCNSVNTSSCGLDVGLSGPIARLFEAIPGCAGSPPATCGVSVATPVFDATNRTFTGSITYNGTEVSVKPSAVTIIIPVEILQSAAVTCTGDTPFFKGFLPTGAPDCRGFTSCGPGQILRGFNTTTLAADCVDIQSAGVSCPAGQYISTMNWTAAGAVTVTCTNRPPPSTLWPPMF